MNHQVLRDKIASVRRQTRSQDIMDICDALESRLLITVPVVSPAEIKPQFDKKSYQRELMRKRRAKAKIGDGVALTSMEHPPGLIEEMAEAIRKGKLKL